MTQNTNITTATIYDVAREAGVSRATVDRVIYKRGGVSAATEEKGLRCKSMCFDK